MPAGYIKLSINFSDRSNRWDFCFEIPKRFRVVGAGEASNSHYFIKLVKLVLINFYCGNLNVNARVVGEGHAPSGWFEYAFCTAYAVEALSNNRITSTKI
jgi:hypothetical protein